MPRLLRPCFGRTKVTHGVMKKLRGFKANFVKVSQTAIERVGKPTMIWQKRSGGRVFFGKVLLGLGDSVFER